MSARDLQAAVLNFLRDEFRREKENGFALLRRIPSTSVRQFMDYFLALNRADQDALAEAFAQLALTRFFPSESHPGESGNVAYKRYVDAMPLMWDWSYMGIRELRMVLAVAKSEPDSSWSRSMTSEIRDRIGAIKPVKATEIRRVVKLALSQIFAPLAIEHEGQYWNYRGVNQDSEVCVTVDYAARHHQLDYQISVKNKEHGIVLEHLNYERVMGFPFAWWDCLEAANLDQSVALLKDLIAYCVEIPRRLPDSYYQAIRD